jgi:hypothetical protein
MPLILKSGWEKMLNKKLKLVIIMLVSLFSTCVSENYYILYLGKETIKEKFSTSGIISSDQISNIENVTLIGKIVSDELGEIKTVNILDNNYKFLLDGKIDEKGQFNIEKFKGYISEKRDRWNEVIEMLGGLSFYIDMPDEYDEQKTEIENYISYLKKSKNRVTVLESEKYEKYLVESEVNKIEMLKETLKSSVDVYTKD